MAVHSITLNAAQEGAVAEIAAWYSAQTPPLGNGTVAGALPLLLKYAIQRLGGQATEPWNERMRTRLPDLTAQQRADITALLGG